MLVSDRADLPLCQFSLQQLSSIGYCWRQRHGAALLPFSIGLTACAMPYILRLRRSIEDDAPLAGIMHRMAGHPAF